MAFSLQGLITAGEAWLSPNGGTLEAGAGAAVASKMQALRSTLQKDVMKLGASVGRYGGNGVPNLLAEGAQVPGASRTSAFERKYLGFALPSGPLGWVLLAVALFGIIWLVYKALK